MIGTVELARIAGVTLRQLQHWDECGYFPARTQHHRRHYSPENAAAIAVLAELRRKGLGLRPAVRAVQMAQADLPGQPLTTGYLIVGTTESFVEPDESAVVSRVVSCGGPVYILDLAAVTRGIAGGASAGPPPV